jgi:predicted glutamine amidotransferase
MCRWLAYLGAPIPMSELVVEPRHSIIDQSLAARQSPAPTNGDGFGLGWYGRTGTPGLYRSTHPAWNDRNLGDLCRHIESPLFMAHVRASTGTPTQQSNCHPFRHGRWLFVHNGAIAEAPRLRRRLATELDAPLFVELEGTTDSELMFYLALHFGMDEDVYGGVARMVGFVEACAREAGVDDPMQMTLGIADGERLFAFRYSTRRASRTLYYAREVTAVRDLLAQRSADAVTDEASVVVSEPLSDLPGLWEAIPESSFLTVDAKGIERRDFAPLAP